jgi:hypothetical protein
MSEVEVVETAPSTSLVLPSGELVDLNDPASMAHALARVREMQSFLKEVNGMIVDAFAEHRRVHGVDEIELENGDVVKVTAKHALVWDAHQLEEDLREAGMPEERIREIIVEETTYTVKAVEANKAAKRNVDYARAVENARTKVEQRPTISLPRG